MKVRTATPADAHGIATIQVHSWQKAYRGLLPEPGLLGLDIGERSQQWAGRCDSGEKGLLVCCTADEVHGFAWFGPCRGDGLEAEDHGEIYAIYVRPDCWRRGVGTAIWYAVESLLREDGRTALLVWVIEGNLQARRFYGKMGCCLDRRVSREEILGQDTPLVCYTKELRG